MRHLLIISIFFNVSNGINAGCVHLASGGCISQMPTIPYFKTHRPIMRRGAVLSVGNSINAFILHQKIAPADNPCGHAVSGVLLRLHQERGRKPGKAELR